MLRGVRRRVARNAAPDQAGSQRSSRPPQALPMNSCVVRRRGRPVPFAGIVKSSRAPPAQGPIHDPAGAARPAVPRVHASAPRCRGRTAAPLRRRGRDPRAALARARHAALVSVPRPGTCASRWREPADPEAPEPGLGRVRRDDQGAQGEPARAARGVHGAVHDGRHAVSCPGQGNTVAVGTHARKRVRGHHAAGLHPRRAHPGGRPAQHLLGRQHQRDRDRQGR